MNEIQLTLKQYMEIYNVDFIEANRLRLLDSHLPNFDQLVAIFRALKFKVGPKRHKYPRTPKDKTENFIFSARQKYGGYYDYSKAWFSEAAVMVGCPKHGFYLQRPRNHLNNGCRKCS